MFFVVWNERHGSPTYKHDSLDQAKEEAMRLARIHVGESFHVLALVGTARKVDVEFVESEFGSDRSIPF